MRSSLLSSFAKIVLCTLFAILAISSAFAVNGAIFTTNDTGTKVNGNLYPAKTAVYLNGGPQNKQDPGLVPDGNYYFQVTDPSGATLLSADDISCREVTVLNGRITGLVSAGCTTDLHLLGTLNTSNGEQPVQLCPAVSSPPRADTLSDGNFDPNNWCDTTPNPGGEYKAWLTPVGNYSLDGSNCSTPSRVSFGFCDADSKTDNFKVQFTPPTCPDPNNPACQGPPPLTASLVACKYWDKDDDGFNEGPDVLLPGWTITASTTDAALVINGGAPGASASGVTDSTGCTTFSLAGFPDGTTPESVTLTETQQTNWNQVAPLDGSYSGGTGGAITVTGNCTADAVTGLVAPCTSTSSVPVIGDGTTTVAPDFGNTGLDLTVSKTANPGFTRTYNWTIAKSVDKTLIETTGSTATFNYTVVASQTGFTDSGWQVTGLITVTNPNSFPVSGVTITENGDGLLLGETCTMNDTSTATEIVTVAANSSTSKSYTCTGYSQNPGSGTNDATATWNATTYHTPDSSADSGTSGAYNFGAPTNPVNKTITVTDTYWTNLPSPTTVTLGTCTATDTTPFASCTFQYSRVIAVKAGCFFYDNTATIKETGQTSKVEVEVCGPAATGALTMGFWQNKNGQGIISGQAKTGLCASGTWLRQYPPFQDLGSTATCAQVATYVYNVIKAATCGGSTCNAMLKPQMLSTALDVYFSDPTLGGNKIGAPGAIGPVKIDLAHVCNMIDGSGGTATCSGTLLNCSSAFGGATCLSVFDILTYAGSQSNVGGSIWYGQVKATQVLAKNVFDAINNRVAFNCP